jgi:hypothetical protein
MTARVSVGRGAGPFCGAHLGRALERAHAEMRGERVRQAAEQPRLDARPVPGRSPSIFRGKNRRLSTVIESWWSQFASECQRLCHPPRLNHRLLIAHGRAPPAGCLRQGYLLPKPLRNCATVPCAGPFRQFPAARGGGAQAGAGAGAAGAGDWRRKLPAASGLVRLQTLPGGAEHAPPVVSTGAGGDHGIDDDQNWLRFSYDSTFGRSHYLHPHPYDSAGIGRLE